MHRQTDNNMANVATFDDLLAMYFLHHTLRPATRKTYRKMLNQFQCFAGAHIGLEEITPDLVRCWQHHVLNTRRCTQRTWNTYLRHISTLYSFALNKALIGHRDSPFSGMQVREGRRPRKTLTDPQLLHICYILKTLLDDEKQGRQFTVRQGRRSALQPAWFWKIAVELLMMTAIRQNQLLHIRLCDLDLSGQQGMPRVLLQGNGSKNHDERWLPLPAELVPGMAYLQQQAIAQKMPLQGQLFNVGWFIDGMQEVRINGMTERQMNSFFTQLSARCGFRVTSHRFRHTLATALMREPERNIAQVKALLGHRSLSSTLVYIEDDPAEICQMLSRRLDSIRQLPGSKHFITG